MTETTKRRILGVAFGLWICYTVLFSMMKIPHMKAIDRYHLDVAFHGSSYLVMALLGAPLLSWPAVLFIGLGIAGMTELVQTALPHRTGAWSDFAVNVTGLFLGLLIWALVRGLRRRVRGF